MGVGHWIATRLGLAMAAVDTGAQRLPEPLVVGERAYVLGPATIDQSERQRGHDPNDAAETYLAYAATSNAVYACVRLRATLLASLPLRFYRLRANGEREEITSGRVVDLFSRVNPHWTFSRLVEMLEWSLCLTGNAFVFLERGASGRQPPRELWWARPDRVRIVPDPTDYLAGFLYEPPGGGPPISYKPGEVWWLRYPNPLDEYAGLAPLAAARLAADAASAAMKSNYALFQNGIQAGGFIFPAAGQPSFTAEQQQQLRELLNRQLRGVANAHRWGVFDREVKIQQVAMSPKDAEFLGALRWTLEDICRAFGVPLDLVGGQRTYENVQAAHLAIWTNTIVPEARFIATEITEQLLPLFPGEADLAEFDLSGVAVLRESESEKWQIAREQIDRGVLVVNEYRQQQGLDPVPWGDSWWAPINLVPVTSSAPPEPQPAPEAAPPPEAESEPRSHARQRRDIPYGSPEHERLWRQLLARTTPWERRMQDLTADLFRRQRAAILDRLQRPERSAAEAADEPFDLARWIRAFRQGVRPVLAEFTGQAGQQAIDDLGLGLSFSVSDPEVLRAIESQAQKYAREINQTTYDRIKQELKAGIASNEGIPQLAERVRAVMGARIAEAEMIARTEVTAAYNQATLLGWRQSGVVRQKRWLAALDDRTRPTHRAAHGQVVAIDEDFQVGKGQGPAPGLINRVEEVVRCRCTMTAVLDVDAEGAGG